MTHDIENCNELSIQILDLLEDYITADPVIDVEESTKRTDLAFSVMINVFSNLLAGYLIARGIDTSYKMEEELTETLLKFNQSVSKLTTKSFEELLEKQKQ